MKYLVILLIALINCLRFSAENITVAYQQDQKMNQNMINSYSYYKNITVKQAAIKSDHSDKAILNKNLKRYLFKSEGSNQLFMHMLFVTYEKVYGASTMVEEQDFNSPILANQEQGAYQLLFSSDIQLGGNTFHMLFTTYSNILFVQSDQCNKCYSWKQEGKTYTCTNQKCSKQSKKLMSTQIEKSFVDGYVSKDNLTIGNVDIEVEFLSVYSQENLNFEGNGDFKGVIGFGAEKKGSLINEMYKQKKIKKNLFCVQINYIVELKYFQPQITIGEYSSHYNSHQIHYFPLVDKDQWSILLYDAAFYGQKIFHSTNETRKLIIALNFNVILVPEKDYDRFEQILLDMNLNKISQNQLVFECTEENYLNIFPKLSLTLKDKYNQFHTYELLPSLYITISNNTQCVLAMQKGNNQDWLIGNNFLFNFVTVFNYEKQAIGLISNDQIVNGSSSSYWITFLIIIIIAIGLYFIIPKLRESFNQRQQIEEHNTQLITLNQK